MRFECGPGCWPFPYSKRVPGPDTVLLFIYLEAQWQIGRWWNSNAGTNVQRTVAGLANARLKKELLELALSQKVFVMSGKGTVGLRVSQEPSLETSLDRLAHLLTISICRGSSGRKS
jgi:hypothetical protein